MIVYRLVQEALTNAVRYAGESPVDVQLIYSPTAITVFVDDEGTGVPPSAARNGAGGGHGLVGMQERLAAIGGTLEAGPRRPGAGLGACPRQHPRRAPQRRLGSPGRQLRPGSA